MSKETALSRFRQAPWNYNCAQTICAAFDRPDLLDSLSVCGGGRAPEGLCGALFGAIQVLPKLRNELIHDFMTQMGAKTCHDLKRIHHAPCAHCVAMAADLVTLYKRSF